MADRRTFIRAGGLLATGMAVASAAAEPALASAQPPGLALLTWHAALANRRWEPAVIAVLGSSTSEGVGASRYGRGYVPTLAENLRTAFPVAGATGGDNYVAAWGRPADGWPVTLSDGVVRETRTGWGLKAAGLTAPGQSVTCEFTGTSVRVWFSRTPGGGRFSVTVDGAVAAAPVDTGGPSDRDATWTSGPLPAGPHTVVVTALDRRPVFVHGFATFHGDEERGVHVYNGGHGGRTSGDFAAGISGWAPRLRSVRPHLVILQLGVNDWRTDVPAGTVKNNLRTIIEAVRSHTDTDPSFVVYGSPRVTTGTPAQEFALFTNVWREIAAEDTGGPGGGSGVAYFDLAARQIAPSAGNHQHLYCDDLLHTNDRGAAFTADALASFLTP